MDVSVSVVDFADFAIRSPHAHIWHCRVDIFAHKLINTLIINNTHARKKKKNELSYELWGSLSLIKQPGERRRKEGGMDEGGCCWQGKLDLMPAESTGMGATVRQRQISHTYTHTHMHSCTLLPLQQCDLTAAGACHPVVGEVHRLDTHTYTHIEKEGGCADVLLCKVSCVT